MKPWILVIDTRYRDVSTKGGAVYSGKLLNGWSVAHYVRRTHFQPLLNISRCAQHFERVVPRLGEWWAKTAHLDREATASEKLMLGNGRPQQVR